VSHIENVQLGKTDIKITPIGLGTWQWGDRLLWGYTKTHTESDIRAAFQVSVDAGINFIDTAEVYGSGQSELYLGKFLKEIPTQLVIASKFMPYPWRLMKGALRSAVKDSLKRLGLKQVDLYQIHWPFPPVPIQSWMDAMADVVAEGLVRSVGVSNYSTSQMKRAYDVLSRRGISLASNQVEYSLLERNPEKSGLKALCQELGITIIAYSPLAKGALTGKYSPDNLPPGLRSRHYNKSLFLKIQPVIRALRDISRAHDGKTPAQISLNWLTCKGAVAIPGAKNIHQAKENAGALGWQMSEEEVAILDRVSEEVSN
jgi:aryl-alcohol dehydrogenase-like predicted oxidoreductase